MVGDGTGTPPTPRREASAHSPLCNPHLPSSVTPRTTEGIGPPRDMRSAHHGLPRLPHPTLTTPRYTAYCHLSLAAGLPSPEWRSRRPARPAFSTCGHLDPEPSHLRAASWPSSELLVLGFCSFLAGRTGLSSTRSSGSPTSLPDMPTAQVGWTEHAAVPASRAGLGFPQGGAGTSEEAFLSGAAICR